SENTDPRRGMLLRPFEAVVGAPVDWRVIRKGRRGLNVDRIARFARRASAIAFVTGTSVVTWAMLWGTESLRSRALGSGAGRSFSDVAKVIDDASGWGAEGASLGSEA